jgi:hypothetical protein
LPGLSKKLRTINDRAIVALFACRQARYFPLKDRVETGIGVWQILTLEMYAPGCAMNANCDGGAESDSDADSEGLMGKYRSDSEIAAGRRYNVHVLPGIPFPWKER